MLNNRMLVGLHDPAALDRLSAGSKAANLARVLQAGFPVPAGVILTTEAFEQYEAGASSEALPGAVVDALQAIACHYGDVALAVRSSAVAEDLPDAAFAGHYETVLDVRGSAALESAVRQCWESMNLPSVAAYRAHSGAADRSAMAVLVQPMVRPMAAGVALGADPITGDNNKVLVSAVPGSGAALVAGETVAEEWEVSPGSVICRSSPRADVLTAHHASQVAEMLRDIERVLGVNPLDMEWAIADGRVLVLQARPMTALPDQVAWSAPGGGAWFRSIRLGELLPEPITPLFETWMLQRVEERFRQLQAVRGGMRVPAPMHVCVHGWYFSSPLGSGRQTALLGGWIRCPRLAAATVLASRWPTIAEPLFYGTVATSWTTAVLGPYQRVVAECERDVDKAEPAELIEMVDRIADTVGDFYWALVLCGGAAWRFEIALARFFRRHLDSKVAGSYQLLLGGLAAPTIPAHAVHSLDWIRGTAGELAPEMPRPALAASRHQEAAATRRAAEAACRDALSTQRRRQTQFTRLLELAQRYALLRADQARSFTLAWPVLRRCLHLLGRQLVSAGVLHHHDDIFFISRSELGDCFASGPLESLADRVRERRETWERQRRLTPPLVLGKPPFLLAKLLLTAPKSVRSPSGGPASLRGTPASPGVASGPVRVLRDPADITTVRDGDVLVVSAAVPALTVVFFRIAALCADNGSVAAHASLIAREYGIPAVTGLGDATSRLSDEMWVTVDGSAGVVHFS